MLVSNSWVIFTLLVGITVIAKPLSSSFIVHERRDAAPIGFTLMGETKESSQLNLRLALTSNDLAGLEKTVYKTAFRNNGVIRDHLTKEEMPFKSKSQDVEKFVSPTNETTSKVVRWLFSNEIDFTTTTSAGDWLQINVDVATANRLLDTNFMSFDDDSTGKEVIRTLSYSIPTELQPHIQFIHPTISFPVKVKQSPLSLKPRPNAPSNSSNITARAVPSSCNTEITPTCLFDLYEIPSSTASQTASRIGIAEFVDQFPQQADLTAFLKAFRPDLPSALSFTLQTLDGGTDPQNRADAGIEANLNVQYTAGLATNIPVEVISVGEQNTDGVYGFLDLVNFLLAQSAPPQVLLIAFGFNENQFSVSMANSLCNGYMQLAARGVSVIISSGDGGVAGTQSESCTTFIPTFTSTCPFVTSVGPTSGVPEVGASFGGGGFSNIFGIPSYQTTAVEKYLSTIGTGNAGLFNRTGRGFPDVSAQGANAVIFNKGVKGSVDGSSVSATIFASVIGLLNAELLSSGFPTAGLLNPLIYSNPSILNDITSGDNPGCDTNGFSATTGWDPVTGLGTPNFAAMLLQPGF